MALTKMTPAEYADFERAHGARILCREGAYWRKVRTLFYQPLLFLQEPSAVSPPWPSYLGAYQHVVSDPSQANSRMEFLLFENPGAYAVGEQKNRHLKAALKRYQIREFQDPARFAQEAHPVYLDFKQRSHYEFLNQRVDPRFFREWSEMLFRVGKLLIYGAYMGDQLHSVSISFLVERTLFYATSFARTEGLKHGVTDMALHYTRQVAASMPDVGVVYVGRYRNGSSLDRFYMQRGVSVVAKPALLRLNPAAGYVLKHWYPDRYRRLHGLHDATSNRTGVGADDQVDAGSPASLTQGSR